MTTIARAEPSSHATSQPTSQPTSEATAARPLIGGSNHIYIEDFVEDGRYVLRADLPGVDPETDVRVTITGDLLTVSGRRRPETHDRAHREVGYGTFSRSLRLPSGARTDEARARYDAGVLQVTVPVGGRIRAPIDVPVKLGRELRKPGNR